MGAKASIRTSAAVVVAIVLGLSIRYHKASAASGPTITSVTAIVNCGCRPLLINGSGFGTHSAYDGNSSYIELEDTTGNWRAGWQDDPRGPNSVHLRVVTWIDSQVAIFAVDGGFGTNGWNLNTGDNIVIRVWNASTGAGPAVFSTKVQANAVPASGTPNDDSMEKAVQGCVSAFAGDAAEVATILYDAARGRWTDVALEVSHFSDVIDCATVVGFITGVTDPKQAPLKPGTYQVNRSGNTPYNTAVTLLSVQVLQSGALRFNLRLSNTSTTDREGWWEETTGDDYLMDENGTTYLPTGWGTANGARRLDTDADVVFIDPGKQADIYVLYSGVQDGHNLTLVDGITLSGLNVGGQ